MSIKRMWVSVTLPIHLQLRIVIPKIKSKPLKMAGNLLRNASLETLSEDLEGERHL
jgi:hypothetical protein